MDEDDGINHHMIEVNGIHMHVAEKGTGPVILFVHGFPESWYTWRHQITAFASLGYRCLAPDLRGFGETEIPASPSVYTTLHVSADLIGLLDAMAADQEKVFVVGHDWGAIMAWNLSLYRPDRIKALVNLSVPFTPRNPKRKPLESLKATYGDDYYICRFQEPGDIESEFAKMGTARVLKGFLAYQNPAPLRLPRGSCFGETTPETSLHLPPWLSEQDFQSYVSQYEKTGFTGGLNYYRSLDLNWEMTAAWTGGQVKVPAKFIVGDLDLTYHAPGVKDYLHKGGMKKSVPLLEEVIVMEGVGHFINEQRPNEVNKHIHDFIKKMEKTQGCVVL